MSLLVDLLVETLEETKRQIAQNPRSASTEQSVAQTIEAIDEFLASPLMEQLRELGAEERAAVLSAIAGQTRSMITGLRDMLSVALQAEELGDPAPSWTPALAGAIKRLEDAFEGIPISPGSRRPRLSSPTQAPASYVCTSSGWLRAREARVRGLTTLLSLLMRSSKIPPT